MKGSTSVSVVPKKKIWMNWVDKFESLFVSLKTVKKLNSMGYVHATLIQRKCIPLAIRGRDIMASSKTGSGKTLCFIIPIIEKLVIKKWSLDDMVGGCIICPVKELAIQIYAICKSISSAHSLNVGLFIGGVKTNTKKNRASIIVTSIGRLCEEILVSKKFNLDSLNILAVDEIDQILDLGFKRSFLQILKIIPKSRQTLLFSATLTTKIKDLVRLNLNRPIFLYHKTDIKKTGSCFLSPSYLIPKNIYQYYSLVESNQKTNFLYSFLCSHYKKKSLVIFSTNKQVTFFSIIFSKLRPNFLIFKIHGGLKQIERTANYVSFNQTNSGVLFASDVISRGIDFKSVDWVVQFDCPQNIKYYLHRIGRTGRLSEIGQSLLILTQAEKYFLFLLQKHSILISKIKIREKQLTKITENIVGFISKEKDLYINAHSAFMNYTRFTFSVQYNRNPEFSTIDWKKLGENYGIFR